MCKLALGLFASVLVLLIGCSKDNEPTAPPVELVRILDGWASWSPDGRYIYYTRPARDTLEALRHGQFSIFGYDTQTSRYGFLVGPGMFPKWNPEGTILAFSWGQALYFYYADGRTVRLVPVFGEVYTFDWAPSGRSLVLSTDDGRVIDTLGNIYRHLMPWNGSNGGWRGNGQSQWSSSGDRILMTTTDTLGYSGILVLDSLGAIIDTVIRVDSPHNWYSYACWSLNESQIVVNYSYIDGAGFTYGDFRLYSMSGNLDMILTEEAGAGEWSPDGTKIVFQKYTFMGYNPDPLGIDYGRVTIWICNADGSDMHELLGWPQAGFDSTMFDGGYNWLTDTYGP